MANKDSVGTPEQSKKPEVKKDVMLFSQFPEYEIYLEQVTETKILQDGKVERFTNQGKRINFKNNKALVPYEVAEKLVSHRKFNISLFNLEELKKRIMDPKKRRWAKKFQTDVERRRGMHDSNDEAFFLAILESKTKIGGVEVVKS